MIMMTLCLCACTARSSSVVNNDNIIEESEDYNVNFKAMEIQYAHGFSISSFEQDYFYITIGDQKIVTIPEGKDIPAWVKSERDVVVLQQPLNDIYVAATSIPDMIDCLGKLDSVSYTSTTYEDWALTSMKTALEELSIEYVGKYRAPDYEVLLANGCNLAIESTMIYHSPEVFEKLEALGIPVIVDASSYESDPLGRLEWIKVYGAILGCYDESVEIFDNKITAVKEVEKKVSGSITESNEVSVEKNESASSRPSVAFFYINSNGSVVVRKPGDYVTKMIDIAGGDYVIKSMPEEENALSTMNMQMETFYAEAIDADILIYNSTIDGEINSIEELLDKCELLKDFKAVKNGNVWCSGKNMFQESSSVAEMIEDLSALINDEIDDLTYFHRIE